MHNLTLEELATLPMLGEVDNFEAKWIGINTFVPNSIPSLNKQLEAIKSAKVNCSLILTPKPGTKSAYIRLDTGGALGLSEGEAAAAVICRSIGGEFQCEGDEELLNLVLKVKRVGVIPEVMQSSFHKKVEGFVNKYCRDDADTEQKFTVFIHALQNLDPKPELVSIFEGEQLKEIHSIVKTYFLDLVEHQSLEYFSKCAYTVGLWLSEPCANQWNPKYNPKIKPIHETT